MTQAAGCIVAIAIAGLLAIAALIVTLIAVVAIAEGLI